MSRTPIDSTEQWSVGEGQTLGQTAIKVLPSGRRFEATVWYLGDTGNTSRVWIDEYNPQGQPLRQWEVLPPERAIRTKFDDVDIDVRGRDLLISFTSHEVSGTRSFIKGKARLFGVAVEDTLVEDPE